MFERVLPAGMLTSLLLISFTVQADDNWSSFHNGGNTSIDAGRLPLRWTPDEGVDWSVPLPGYGQSAPVVWNDRLYLTAVEGDNKESNILLASDVRSGEILWTRRLAATVTVRNSYMVSRAAPTPLVDASGVYALFESGDLQAFSHDSQPLWQRSLFDSNDRAFQNGHGYGASPAQTHDAVIVLVDHRGPSYLMSASKKTGETLWRTERSPRSSWSSPRVVRIGDQTQIVVSSSGTVDGYDAATGKALWSHTGVSGNLIPSASASGDRIFVGAAVSRTDPDARSAAASNCCLQITPDSPAGYRLLWQADKAVCDYTSPLAYRGHVYYINKVGVVYCLDAATGQQ
ncbi:MAG: PQQ-binding-like beta-propeller repeat protein [Planctomycetota bacterium]|nr:PQQ-binding-like beta-propeller repeat protein [Planctomycetota bacterium]